MKLTKKNRARLIQISKAVLLGIPLVSVAPEMLAEEKDSAPQERSRPLIGKIRVPGVTSWKAGIPTNINRTYRIHIVQKGETLTSISKKYFKNADRVKDIIALNPELKDNPDLITVGMQLKIPKV